MSEQSTPETDAACGYALNSNEGRSEGSYLQIDRSGPFVHVEVARKLERERDDARAEWGKASMDAAQLLSEKTKVMAERDEAREALMEIEDRCVDCEDACGDIQKIRDIAVKALEEPK